MRHKNGKPNKATKQVPALVACSATGSTAACEPSAEVTVGLSRRSFLYSVGVLSLSACGGGGSGSAATADGRSATDITAAILANQNVTLSGDAIIRLPVGSTTYTGVISGKGTLVLAATGGTSSPSTLIITQTSTFTLPDAQQVEVVTKTSATGGYRLDISGTNPPVLTIDAGVTLQIGTNTSADNAPNIIATSDSLNAASLVNGEVNLNNILNNGRIVLSSAQFILLGEISGSGPVLQGVNVWGGNSMRGVHAFEGVLSLSTGHDFGSNHVAASLSSAKAVLNEGSWLVWSPPGSVVKVTQNIYEAAFGGDINFHPIGNSTIVMSGVYSHTDNSPHNSPNLVDPGLSDASLNFAKVIYRGGANDVNGNDGSYRGINIEAGGGTVQWGDGTHSHFFLPSAPSPAEVSPALGAKNAYINLHSGSTLAFNYNGAVTLNVGITGGGGGPNRTGAIGVGNVTIMGTAGNDVTFAQPQNYNGTTTIGANAILRLGVGSTVPLNYTTVRPTGKTTVLQATYTGDSSLLTAESTGGLSSNAIVNAGQLIIQNTSTNITLSNISGSGSLVHNGAITTTLLNNSYSGATTINRGTLLAGSSGALGTGSVVNNAALALTSTRALAIGGGFQQGSGGSLTLAVNGTSPGVDFDQLTVAGAAVLGGTLTLNITGSYTSGQKLVLVNAASVSGTFSSITSNGTSVVGGQDATSFYVIVQ
ncbi:autotransporter-associated beta strand protein [Rhodoferax ferrireducens]|uniref:Autotransporter-associated beta strand protein n=1 Tax=Rhodoferax ferrireducens TaxID=192843 RepID=A0ABU2C211_9BURK|nr:autotransporter [Rhodoferax ferrireducens]MDR7375381.1 autotransporter-associated beta strand protein [Rhodoferax ferrireducens]